MKLKLNNNNSVNFIAAFAAFVLHAGIVVAAMLPSDPIVISQQVMQVSFVAPNSANSKNANPSQKKIAKNKTENSINQKKQEAKEVVENEEKQKSTAGKETSGRVDERATATRSAESDPVFDAEYLNNPAPSYPIAAKKRGIQGKVLLSVIVKTDGSALQVAISHSSGSSILDEAALDAVKQWRFVPAKRSGQLVQANVIVPVEFKII